MFTTYDPEKHYELIGDQPQYLSGINGIGRRPATAFGSGGCLKSTAMWLSVSLALSAASTGASPAHDGKVVWSLDFDGEDDQDGWSTEFHNGTLKHRDNLPEISLRVANGALNFNSRFNLPRERSAYAVLGASPGLFAVGALRGNAVNEQSAWPGISVSDSPVLEIRSRQLHEEVGCDLVVVYSTRSGDILSDGYPLFEDDAGNQRAVGEWGVATVNMYGELQVTGPSTVQRIIALQLRMRSRTETGADTVANVIEVDYLRARRMNREEWACTDRRLAPLRSGFQMQPCPRVEEFFGVGFWGYVNGEENLDRVARAGANIMLNTGGRFGGNVWGHVGEEEKKDEETRAAYWLIDKKHLLQRKYGGYGIYVMAGMDRFESAEEGHGAKPFRDLGQLNRWADEVTAELRHEPYLLGWYILDEPHKTFLTNYLMAKQLLETRDRTRAALCLFNTMETAALYAPHSQVMITLDYPGSGESRAGYAWDIADWLQRARRVTAAPQWITLGTFRPPDYGPVTRRDGADLLERSWLAIAEGAKVVTYFLFKNYPRWVCMLDGDGNTTPWYDAFEEFAGKVMPLGPVLVRSEPDDGLQIQTSAQEIDVTAGRASHLPSWIERRPGVHVGTLKVKDRDAHVLVPVNLDIDNAKTDVSIHLPARLTAGKHLYDLHELLEVPIEAEKAACHALVPGAGYAYLLGSEADFTWAKKLIIAARDRQTARIAELDARNQ